MGSAVVSVRALDVSYGSQRAVRAADLDVPEGAVMALVGPSGCGKTSLLRAIAGFEVPAGGRIEIREQTVAGAGVWVPPEARRVGMVFQDGALFPHLSVYDNVAFGVASHPEAQSRVADVLELVRMHDLAHRFPDQLSGGQQQRVALARALAPAPAVVLLDEPFSSLDPVLRESVRDEVRSILEQAGATAVLVTHDQQEALSFADTVAVMSRGRILQVGSPDELYRRPATLEVARLVGDGRLVECDVRDGQAECAFGRFPVALPDGEAMALVRPEDLLMFWATEEDTGPRGTIVRRRFFGHDILEDVRMEDGAVISVRLIGLPGLPVGTPVRLRLRHSDLQVFAVEPNAPRQSAEELC